MVTPFEDWSGTAEARTMRAMLFEFLILLVKSLASVSLVLATMTAHGFDARPVDGVAEAQAARFDGRPEATASAPSPAPIEYVDPHAMRSLAAPLDGGD